MTEKPIVRSSNAGQLEKSRVVPCKPTPERTNVLRHRETKSRPFSQRQKGPLLPTMRRPVVHFQRWRQRWASTHVRTASCAGRKDRMWWRIPSGRAPMQSIPGGIRSNRRRAPTLRGKKLPGKATKGARNGERKIGSPGRRPEVRWVRVWCLRGGVRRAHDCLPRQLAGRHPHCTPCLRPPASPL